MALINCPECSKDVSDKAESCPNCAYPIMKKQKTPEAQSLQPMLWDTEDGEFIYVQCPSCTKISAIKPSAAIKMATGYKLKGEGKCTCGHQFDEIYRDERIKCNTVHFAKVFSPPAET